LQQHVLQLNMLLLPASHHATTTTLVLLLQCAGATLYAFRPAVVASRRSAYTSKGQEVTRDMTPIKGSLWATKKSCEKGSVRLRIYQCDNTSSTFTDEPGMKLAAEAYLIVPPGRAEKPKAKRMILYTVHIDGVELVMRAKWEASGEAVEVRTSFQAA
jgi:hypothetical protein